MDECRSISDRLNLARCALSFLAIQTPGTTKSCGICNTLYLNEQLVPDLQSVCPDEAMLAADAPVGIGDPSDATKQGVLVKEPLVSLARVLFSAVDRCVCCGGKFIG